MEDICKSVLTRHRGVRHEPGGCSACSRLSRGNDDEILHSRWICFLNPDNRRVGLRIVDFLCERHVSFAGGYSGMRGLTGNGHGRLNANLGARFTSPVKSRGRFALPFVSVPQRRSWWSSCMISTSVGAESKNSVCLRFLDMPPPVGGRVVSTECQTPAEGQ